MAEHIAIAATMGIAEMVAARVLDEIDLAWGFKDQLLILNNKLEYVQAFLEDAGNSKHAQKSRLVNLWVQKVKDAAYLADNVMDEYAIEILRRRMELKHRFRKKFSNFFWSSNHLSFRVRMAHKVEEILSLFDEIAKDTKDIGLNQVDIAAKALTDTYNFDNHLGQTRQHAGATASEFVGREEDEAKLLDVLCSPLNEERNLCNVAIVGMGGLGKTTLARRVYDHERISAHFGNNKIWICVSQKFEITRILNEMIESVTSSTSELSNTDAILRKLQQELTGKKVLLVFDDVWHNNQESWGSLKGLLHRIGTAPGSVILITTRGDEVAKAAGVIFNHKLKGLSEDESWSLFNQIVFNNTSRPQFSSVEGVGRRIVKKCTGVPLAVKVIGGLLQLKYYLHEWESIEKSELWDLPHGQNHILPSLLLSFNHLPSSSLKQCFAYCAVIPKGNYVYKSELIGLWLSQGYLRNEKRTNLTMEEIGEKNLKILLSNSLLEECASKLPGIVGYEMHDLVYDLAVYVCGSELLKDANDMRQISCCRHLAINSSNDKDFPPEKVLANLRTLDLKGTVLPWNMLSHTRYLRTLILDRTGITEVPPAIGLLKHLRLLDVSYNPISTLPNSIGKLYQLQTLILQGCTYMVTLPNVVNKLVNLRHISTTAPMFACKGLQRLTNLQSLPSLCLDDDREGWTIDELGDLHQLRDEIHILGLEHVKGKPKARKARLIEKANLTKLTLSWVEGREKFITSLEDVCDELVLEGLEPHPNILSLEVQNFIGAIFPLWIAGMAVHTQGPRSNRTQLNNLTTVKLLNCTTPTLPKLGQLPFLKCLVLSGLYVEHIDNEFYGGVDLRHTPGVISFHCLRELDISRFYKLTTWMDPPQAAFPRLETLRIRNCSLLKSVPALRVKSLQRLELGNLHSVESLDIIKFSSGLTSLIINMLPEISSLPPELANCKKLQILSMTNLGKRTSLSRSLEPLINFEVCTSLEMLSISKCSMIDNSPTNISKLQRLSDLRISCSSAKHLRAMLEAAQYLPLLRCMAIEGFKDEEEMRDYFSDITPFLRLSSLRHLILQGHQKIKTLPQQLCLFTRITALYIWDFEDLEEIPDWICNISSLDSMILEFCDNLRCLPSKQHLQRIAYLKINYCPLLVERYAKDGCSEWHNISHIRQIEINGYRVQDLDP